MRTATLVYAGSLTDYAFMPLGGGESAYERALAFAAQVPGSSDTFILAGKVALPPGAPPSVRKESWTRKEVLAEAEVFAARLRAEGRPLDALVMIRADEPFLDPALLERMLDNYRRYRAEYSFADGFPAGFAAEIIHPRILPTLVALSEKAPGEPDRGWLFKVVQKDINAFDIETEISPKDLREFRLDLACDTKRNHLLVERLLDAGVHDAASGLGLIPERLELQRTLPAFVQVQVTGGCPQVCANCPYPQFGGDILARKDFMPRERYAQLMRGLVEFCGDAVVDISLWGEASFHPDIEGLIDETLSKPGLSLIVETSGLGWKRETLERLASRYRENLHFIVSLDACEPVLYEKLRGPGFDEALSTAELLLGLFPKTAYVQTLRTKDNEESLEAFWRGWKKRTENVIVQKYSNFAGSLPERGVCDLSPLVRRPCWHLKRDLSILIDGKVPLCRDCVGKDIILGDLFSGEAESLSPRLAEVWAAGDPWHLEHIQAGLRTESAYPEPCAVCSEYYTYNA